MVEDDETHADVDAAGGDTTGGDTIGGDSTGGGFGVIDVIATCRWSWGR